MYEKFFFISDLLLNFYRMSLLAKIGKFIKASRPFSLPCSLFPAALGYVLAENKVNTLPVFVLILIAIVLLHVAANLLNTYYDFKYKVS